MAMTKHVFGIQDDFCGVPCDFMQDIIKSQAAEIEMLRKFKAYFESLCGFDLEILGVTEDGDAKSYDEFYKAALKEIEGEDNV